METKLAQPSFKRKEQLVFPLLKHEPGKTIFVKFTSEPAPGKKIEEDKDPAMVARVIDLETGEECEMLVASVLLGILTEKFPQGITGHSFEIEKSAEMSGKGKQKYYTFKLWEITS